MVYNLVMAFLFVAWTGQIDVTHYGRNTLSMRHKWEREAQLVLYVLEKDEHAFTMDKSLYIYIMIVKTPMDVDKTSFHLKRESKYWHQYPNLMTNVFQTEVFRVLFSVDSSVQFVFVFVHYSLQFPCFRYLRHCKRFFFIPVSLSMHYFYLILLNYIISFYILVMCFNFPGSDVIHILFLLHPASST